MDTFLIQSNIKTKEIVAECTENRTTPKEPLCCASHTLREIVMELNVDTKRLPPAQETTWTRELEKNTGMLPIQISGPNRGIL